MKLFKVTYTTNSNLVGFLRAESSDQIKGFIYDSTPHLQWDSNTSDASSTVVESVVELTENVVFEDSESG